MWSISRDFLHYFPKFQFFFCRISLLHRHVELRAEMESVTKSWEITSGKGTIPGVLPNGISCYLIYGVFMYGTVKIFINMDNWAKSREVSCGISWNVRDTSPSSWIQQFGGVFYFTESGSLIEEIERTWKKINAMIYQLLPLPKRQSISMKTKSQLINSILILILWCQSHHWLLPKFTKRKGQVSKYGLYKETKP